MARMLLIASVILLAGPALAGDLGALDSDNGFGGAALGEPVDGFRCLELISEHGARGTSLYARTGEMPELGGARLDDVTLGFYRGRLYFLALFTSGRHNAEAALAALQESYGPGTPVPGEASEYLWHGARVTLHFREDPVTKLGMVGFTDRTVQLDTVNSVPASIAE
jgi:hypothetical protein